MIIRSEVNHNVSIWRPGDTVTLIQDGKFSIYEYTANGNFVPDVLGVTLPSDDNPDAGGDTGGGGFGNGGGMVCVFQMF